MHRSEKTSKGGLTKAVQENSLSIAFIALFLLCLAAHGFAGWLQQNDSLAAHGRAAVGFRDYLAGGTFIEALAVNWQAAILQLAALILLSGVLYQRGAPHSRKNRGKSAKRSRGRSVGDWLYGNSLLLAFLLMFVAAFAIHAMSGAAAYNEERALAHQTSISWSAFLVSAKFWSSTLETWEAEFGVIAAYIVLSIFLRQEGSAESKPPEASDESTGEANK
jgi:hypothetical protein